MVPATPIGSPPAPVSCANGLKWPLPSTGSRRTTSWSPSLTLGRPRLGRGVITFLSAREFIRSILALKPYHHHCCIFWFVCEILAGSVGFFVFCVYTRYPVIDVRDLEKYASHVRLVLFYFFLPKSTDRSRAWTHLLLEYFPIRYIVWTDFHRQLEFERWAAVQPVQGVSGKIEAESQNAKLHPESYFVPSPWSKNASVNIVAFL